MGLLDDLRNQVEGQRTSEQEESARLGESEQYYRNQILPRMIKAYQFFKELTEHLNYIKIDTLPEYPLFADGSTHPMRQEGYAVLIDSSKELKQIDVTFQCVLDNPITFDVYSKDASLSHSDRLDRYFIKYERKDKKNAMLDVVASRFTILGPLPLKVGITANIANRDIRIALRNFTDPGTSTYTIKAEEFDDAFLDKLGKFILRQAQSLFGTTTSMSMSDDAKAQLREKILREQQLREQELKEAEERERQEEELRRQNTTKEQLKKAVTTQTEQLKKVVNTQLEQKKEKLKGMFGKLKEQASAVLTAAQKQSPQEPTKTQQPPVPPAQAQPQPKKTISVPETRPQTTLMAKSAERIKASIAVNTAPVSQNNAQMRVPPATPTPKPVQKQVAAKQPAPTPQAAEPSVTENAAPQQAAVQPTTAEPVKKAQPPKIFTASPNNPFIKPEPPEEPAAAEKAEQEAPQQQDPKQEKAQQGKPQITASNADASAPRPDLTPEALEEDLVRILERDNLKDIRVAANTKPSAPAPVPAQKVNLPLADAKQATAPASESVTPAEKSKPVLKPYELNTGLTVSPAVAKDAKGAAETDKQPVVETEAPAQKTMLSLEPLDIDVAENSPPADDDNAKENS